MAPVGNYLITQTLKQVQKEDIPVFNKTKVTKLLQDDKKKVNGVEVKQQMALRKSQRKLYS